MTVENTVQESIKTGKAKEVVEILLTGTGKTYYHTNINMRSNIFLKKNGSTAVVNGTNSSIDPIDGAPYISLEDGGASTDDFLGGDSAGFTGIEVDVQIYSDDLTLIIKNYVVDESAG